MNELQRTGERLLESIAYGDAAGVPFETKSFRYIDKHFGEVDRLHPTTDNYYCKGTWPVGKTSDATQLSVAVTSALIRANGFDMHSIADQRIEAYHVEDRQEDSTGNDILMKMAPLAYWQYIRCLSDQERYRQYDQLTTMTHDSDVARVATRVHGDVLHNLLLSDFDNQNFGFNAYSLALFHEKQLGTKNKEVSDNLSILRPTHGPNVEQIKYIYAKKNKDLDDTQFGRSYGFFVPETLAIAYAAFKWGNQDYHETVYRAVNLGGDADSTASIAGAMVNFLHRGEQRVPDDLDKVQDIDRLRRLSRELATRSLAEEAA